MNKPTRFILLLTGLLLLMSLSTAFAGTEKTVDGVLHIMNPADAKDGVKTLSFNEQWRLGGDNDDEIFGMISQVLVDDDNVYLLDTQLSEVKVYDKDGTFLRTLGREGDGPGEVRTPADMLFMPDGTLGLVQVFPGKVTKLDLEGNPAGTFQAGGGDPTAGGFVMYFDVKTRGDEVILSATHTSQGEGSQTRTTYVASHDAEGNELVRYEASENVLDFQNFKIIEGDMYALDFRKWALGKDGRVYTLSYRNKYAINVYNADGTLDRVIEKEFDPVVRSSEERQEFIDNMRARVQVPFPFDVEAEPNEQTLTGIQLGADGNIWVSSARSVLDQSEGILQTLDVFDPDGHFIRQMAMKCPGDGEEDIVIMPTMDTAIQVTGFQSALAALQGGGAEIEEDEDPLPMEVVYYKVTQ
jgi:6-bladed beta-propeller protein